jgi:hypothetical protein
VESLDSKTAHHFYVVFRIALKSSSLHPQITVRQNRKIQLLLLILATSSAAAYLRGREQNKLELSPPGEHVLWRDPGDPSILDFQNGIGGKENRPQPPFRFVSEDMSGTTPKINLSDSRGANWNVKWGREAQASAFCTRLLWACGYYVTPEYFVESGRIENVRDLKRAKSKVAKDGSFENARFQLRSGLPKYLRGQSWTWTKNPFAGSRELNGLRLLLLLVSNWDAKDARDIVSDPDGGFQMDTNLAIFADDSSGARRYLYTDDDWGASLGKWGGVFGRTKWDCKGFAEQTSHFLKVQDDGSFEWGYEGKRRKDVTEDIRPADIQWFLTYLGKITDEQIRSGLAASGATPVEIDCYSQNLLKRIELLQQAAAQHATARP